MKIKNWHQFQHFKDRRPPWIKLHREILDNYDINMISSDAFKFLVQLWLLASEDENMEGNLPTVEQISFKLRINKNKCLDLLRQVDIFLISEGYQEACPSREEKRERQSREEPSTDFITLLRSNPAYSHIDLDRESAKMDAWLAQDRNKNRKKTQKFILNWLNKIEKPLEIKEQNQTVIVSRGVEE